MKKTIKEVFGTEQPIIALLHLRALPGDPDYPHGGKMADVIAEARKDLHALQNGGVDGILISNEFSLPYLDHCEMVTPAAMAYIIGVLKDEITVPFGVHVISDADATIELAAAVEAEFVRSVFSGAYVSEIGIRNRNVAETIRRKKALELDDLLMFYMINAESDGDLSGRDIATIAKALNFKCHPDAMCVSGIQAGHGVDSALLEIMKTAVPDMPVYANTGCKAENIAEKLTYCDGAFVGTSFKTDGKFENGVDEARVKEFMDIVKSVRTR